jgi:hypothetical protein
MRNNESIKICEAGTGNNPHHATVKKMNASYFAAQVSRCLLHNSAENIFLTFLNN